MRHYLKEYIKILTCPFYMYEGGAFAVWRRGSRRQIREKLVRGTRELCYAENDWNRHHFELILTKDRWHNFLQNSAFAQATLVAWGETLAGKKEKADRRLFVSNRLMGWQDLKGFVTQHILPTIHLYTVSEGSEELDALYCFAESGPEVVWNMETRKLISLEEARQAVEAPPKWEPLD